MTIGRQSDFMTNLNPPKQTVLERLHKKSISAKDIANQFWCEKQMELNYVHGQKFTPAMDKGMAVHAQMQSEVYVPLTVEPISYPDRLYKTAYENISSLNTLLEKKIAREIKVFGALNGYNVVGQIDELRMIDGKVVIVENKTTGGTGIPDAEFTKPHAVQVMLYRKMLEEIKEKAYTYQNFEIYAKTNEMKLSEKFLEGLKSIGIKDELMNISALYRRMFDSMTAVPLLSDSLIIHYVSRNNNKEIGEVTINYDRNALKNDLLYAMQYWRGERDAAPVPEAELWKCSMCRFFGKECTVWWKE